MPAVVKSMDSNWGKSSLRGVNFESTSSGRVKMIELTFQKNLASKAISPKFGNAVLDAIKAAKRGSCSVENGNFNVIKCKYNATGKVSTYRVSIESKKVTIALQSDN